jgi:hypothetical protein
MSAEVSARTVRQAEGLDPVRALQRVLYCSAKQNRTRRFHALYDKVARSDVMWRAWVDVATNQGAPGVDGVTIADIESGGVESVQAFLDNLAQLLTTGGYRPQPLLRVHIPKPVGARYSAVGAELARCAAILNPRVSRLVPLLGDAGSPGRALGPFERS